MRIAKLRVNYEFANYELLFMNISQECKEYASCELQVNARIAKTLRVANFDFGL